MEYLQAIILGIIEGLTEFIPVSSTGHLIIAGHLLGFEGDKAASFEIFIQLGAILAVVLLYRQRFASFVNSKSNSGFAGLNGLKLLALTTLPALVLGLLLHSFIKEQLFNSTTVAIGLGLGGIVLIVVERLLPKPVKFGLDSVNWRNALVVGLFQCLALWPGVSRSASTIVGGMLSGIERKTAAEFSFFAGVPVLFAATFYDLFKSLKLLQIADLPVFLTGFVIAFITAWFAIKFFLRLLGSQTLEMFGWYRLLLALIVVLALR